jgi:flagellar biosynthetic protein FliP
VKRNWRYCVFIAAGLALCALGGGAAAQTVTVDFGEGGTFTGRIVQLVLLVAVLALAPTVLIVITSFTRIIVVLSLLRSALGIQSTPPNVVLISLALFLTFFIMQPAFDRAYTEGIRPLIEDKMEEGEAMQKAAEPFHGFMLQHVRAQDLALFLEVAKVGPVAAPDETPYRALVPAFMISELKRAFEIGFLLFVPFLVIDMVVASVLMSMGMMMLPPIVVALPFKLIFFVLVDGWSLVAGSLVRSFAGA